MTERPLRRDAERNRQRLLEAARELMARDGLRVPYEEIARTAGSGMGTLYRRFPDRQDLVDAPVRRTRRRPWSPLLSEDLVDTSVQMLRTVPFVGLIPLFIIWFGIGETPKIAIIALGVSFPLYLNVYAGIRGVDAQLIEAGESLGLSRWGLVRHVVLPGALPGAMTGLRYSLGVAWLALVFAEQVNADSGIGFLMVQARDFLRTDVIVVCLIVYAFLGLIADFIVRTLERLLLQWRPTFTGR
ncbi:hypothetical protein SALBM135S_01530 [Streptomyces alboniger]